MNLERERRAGELFGELCDRPETERRERLARLAREDPELARAVEDLLAHDPDSTDFLGTPALGEGFRLSGPWAAVGQLAAEDGEGRTPHPQAIGPYRILEPIGEGGMGIVYRAEQPRTHREVALKVVRAGLFDARAHRFFELEAEALGRLTHPGIARIHEAGTADFGRGPVPFLVMELVEGPDLVSHADQARLGLRDRVELLVEVCDAVHHAHQHQVVHRDLKPANVLVPGDGRPRLLDFGLAHLADGGHAGTASAADRRRILGTLAYMAPERVDPEREDLGPRTSDAATDIYSLGATALELLGGRPPFDLTGLSLPQALYRVAHGEPARLRDHAPAADRDLDSVVAKAMARSRDDRYRSAAAFAEDLTRWLRHEPVLARPAGRVEQLVLFARRNRLAVGAAVAVVLALVAGIVGTTWQAASARSEAARAERIRTYLQDTLRSASDPRTDGQELPISHVLARAAEGLEAAFPEDPLIRAELADTLGMSYFENGKYPEALELVGEGLRLRAAELGEAAPEALDSRHDLGVVLIALGRHGEAEEHLRAALEGRRARLGAEHEDTQRSANWLGQVLLQKADPSEAAELFEESWSIRRRTLGEEALPTLSTRERLAQVWRRQGRLADAERALREVLAAQRGVCSPSDFDVYETLNNLSAVLLDRGRVDEAEVLLEEAIGGYQRLRGSEHPDTELVQMNLAVVRAQLARAAPGARGAPAEKLKDPRYYALKIPAAIQKFYAGRLEEARADLTEAVDALETLGGQERYLAPARQSLASVLAELGLLAEAMTIQRDVLVAHDRAGTGRSPTALAARSALAESLRRAGAHDAALVEARRAFTALQEEAGEAAVYTLSARAILAAVLADVGRLDEALEHARAAAGTAERELGARSPFTAIFRLRLGRVQVQSGQREEAEETLLAAHTLLAERHGPRGPFTLGAARALAELYAGWDGREEHAEPWRAVGEPLQPAPIEASAPTDASGGD